MAVSAAEIAEYVTGQPLADMDLSERAAVESVIGAAMALVGRYVAGAAVPDPVRREAISRLAYFDYHTRMPIKAAAETLPIPSRRQSVNPLRSSGAMALLSVRGRCATRAPGAATYPRHGTAG